MRVITCTHILQGYGLSETCVVVPEMEYDALSSTPRREICVREDTLFTLIFYYKYEDLTKEVAINGWLVPYGVTPWKLVDQTRASS
ncbi:hypothetical protein MTR67_051911 [Solanum verrucosum]|uniref:AMP-dependent synthetase/ligase domain-containing protein n=1 Tax=Solanum verrucosum TaxID=315347 RepID=A0AAF0V8E5_SOLVR|nr:hypothetical protein MTR67_051911 [Solanum verrucosum]